MDNEPSRCFPPAISPTARLLILGSLPGEVSLAKRQYYGHPRNQFWRLVGELIGTDLPSLDYEARLARLQHHEIGLWDVVASASRPGSLDQHMRDITPNPLKSFVVGLQNIEAIAFNGTSASRIGRRQLDDPASMLSGKAIHLLDLPSSSPAHTMSYERKAERWRLLAPYIDPRPGKDG